MPTKELPQRYGKTVCNCIHYCHLHTWPYLLHTQFHSVKLLLSVDDTDDLESLLPERECPFLRWTILIAIIRWSWYHGCFSHRPKTLNPKATRPKSSTFQHSRERQWRGKRTDANSWPGRRPETWRKNDTELIAAVLLSSIAHASKAFVKAVGWSSAVTEGRMGASPHPTLPSSNSTRIATFLTNSNLDEAIVNGAVRGTSRTRASASVILMTAASSRFWNPAMAMEVREDWVELAMHSNPFLLPVPICFVSILWCILFFSKTPDRKRTWVGNLHTLLKPPSESFEREQVIREVALQISRRNTHVLMLPWNVRTGKILTKMNNDKSWKLGRFEQMFR
jgi:hypothetical protein